MSNVFQNALDCYRGNREVAIWNLELRTTGKKVGDQLIRMISTQMDIDHLRNEIAIYDRLIFAFERKLVIGGQSCEVTAPTNFHLQ